VLPARSIPTWTARRALLQDLIIRFGLAIKDIIETFHPYLTMVEGLKLAALSFGKDVGKLSCCAA
jgi:mercuric reductase